VTPAPWWLDALGWAGSAVLILSLSLSNVLRFRVLNLIASVVLTVFNALLGIWPMVAMNAVIAGINVWHLVRLVRTRDDERTYEVVAVDPRSEYLAHLLRVHAADVERHNPGFDLQALLASADPAGRPGGCAVWAFLVMRGDETVGIVLLCDRGDGVARVELDYVTARFRDLSVGTFVYRRDGRLASLGLRRLLASTRMTEPEAYFGRVGFHREGDELVRDVRG
jgi:hypothetical protein